MKLLTSRVWFYRSCLVSAVAGAMVLSGCGSLSEKECHNADWHMFGYEDGAAGRPAARIGQHREACSDYGITPDLQAYRRGREEGLREYCQPRRAYQLGRNGSGYPHACPTELEGALRTAYREGRKIHEVESEINGIQRTLQRKENELQHIEKTQISHQTEIIGPKTSAPRRVQLLAETWDLVKRKDAVEDEIYELQSRVDARREDLSALISTTQY